MKKHNNLATFEPVEPRILFSADGLAGADVNLAEPMTEEPAIEAEYNSTQTDSSTQSDQENESLNVRNEIVFIDENVEGYEALVDDLFNNGEGRNFEIYFIQDDGIDDITSALEGAEDIDAIHIIAHGDEGQIQIGNSIVSNESFNEFSETFSSWSDSLDSEADILIYGCNVAGSEDGQELLGQIAETTGADIAASTDLTGHVDEGGDWILEYKYGELETEVAISEQGQAAFENVLESLTLQQDVNGYTGTQDTYVDDYVHYADNSYGSATTLSVDDGLEQALIRFDDILGSGTNQVPSGSTVNSATLYVYVTHTDHADSVDVHTMLTDWSESSTWNSLSNGISLDGVEASSSAIATLDAGTSGWVSVDVTADIQSVINGGDNYGWLFSGVAGTADSWEFNSSENSSTGFRPYLNIDYTAPVADIESDLVVHLKLDEGTGTTAIDSAGADNNGAISGSTLPSYTTGQVGSHALDFSTASDDGITVSDQSNIDFGSGDFTVSTWFNTGAVSDPSGAERLIGKSNGGAGFVVYNDNSGNTNFQVSDGTTTVTLSASGYQNSAWHQVTAVRNGDSFELYIDNVLVDSTTQTLGSVDNNVDLIIGQHSTGTSNYDGQLDEIRLYNRALNAESVTALYNYREATPTDLSSGIELNNDGGNDAYLISDSGLSQSLSASTFEIRFAANNLPTETVFMSFNNASGDEFSIQTNSLQSNALELDFGNGTTLQGTAIDYQAALVDGQMHSLAVTWDNTNGDYAIYIDGVLIETGTGLNTGNTLDTTNGQFVFGQEQDGLDSGYDSTQYFSGTMYDVRIWNDVRTQAEIASNYQHKIDSSSTPSSLVANWQMDGFNGSNQVVDIVSGNNLSIAHATGTGFTTSTPVGDLNIDENSSNGSSVGYVIPSTSAVAEDIVSDGLFNGSSNATTQYAVTGTFGDWTVTDDSVDLFSTSDWESPLGGRVVNLDGSAPGAIEQTLTTTVGTQYQVVFALSGDFSGGEATKDLRVTAGSTSQDFSITQGSNWTWGETDAFEYRSFTFTADSASTALSFASLESAFSQYGPYIADIQVIEIPASVSNILSSNSNLTYDATTNKFYQRVATGENFSTAQTTAASNQINGVSGQLVTIGSAYENILVTTLAADAGSSEIWLGASDQTTEGDWRWQNDTSDGEQFWSGDASGSAVAGNYSNWGSGEPNNSGGEDQAVLITSSGQWNDLDGASNTRDVLIEWDASQLLASYTFSMTDDAGGRFTIDSNTGEITVADGSLLDYETNTSHDVVVQVTNSAGGTYSETITIQVNDVNTGMAVWGNDTNTSQTSDYDGTSFGTTSGATTQSDEYRIMQGADAPTRNEKIVVGIQNDGDVSGQIWDGSSWTALPLSMGNVSETYWWGADVAYEQVSGDAIVVWNDDGQSGGESLRFSVWNGSSWTTPQSITGYNGEEPQQLKLVADPGSDSMALVISDKAADDYVFLWDGSSWGNAVTLDTSGSADADKTAISVAFEAQSGDAMVTYGKNNNTDVYYRIWDGSTWSSEASVSAPSGTSGEAKWLSTATDHTSDRIVLGTTTASGEAWVSVWNGSSWETALEVTSSTNGTIYPNLAVAFEDDSGEALITYGESSSSEVRYRTWDSGSGWSSEMSISTYTGATPNSMTLDSAPSGNHIMLAVQDSSSDLFYIEWDGNAWSSATRLSSNTGETKNQPFVFIYDQDSALVSRDNAPINTMPGAQTVNEDTALNITGLSVNDVDGNLASTQLSVNNGTLNVSLAGGATISAGSNSSSTLTLSGTQTQINTALATLSYQGNLNFNGSDTLTVISTDSTGTPLTDTDTVSITVNQANDAGTFGGNTSATTNEDTATAGTVTFTDAADGFTTPNFSINTNAANGTAAIDAAGNWTYTPSSNFNGSDSFTVQVTDDDGNVETQVINITVSAVNDAPSMTGLDGGSTYVEGGTAVVIDSDVTVYDEELSSADNFDGATIHLNRQGGVNTDDNFTNSGLLGALTEGGNAVYNGTVIGTVDTNSGGVLNITFNSNATGAIVNSVFQSIAYYNSSDSPPASVSISWNFNDRNTGAQGSEGAKYNPGNAIVYITGVNDPGTFGGNTSATTNEDTATAGTVTFTDTADGYTGNTFAINTTATNGTAAIDTAGNWTYTPSANFNGSDSFTVQVTDDDGNVETQVISITVNQQNDAGTFGGDVSATTNEDTATAGTVTFSDTTDGFTTPNFSINTNAANGTAAIDAAGNWTYTPSANFNGSDSFTVQVTDDDGNVETQVINITVTAENDAPVNTVPGAQTANEDTWLSISGMSVNDVDDNLASTQLSVTNGTLYVNVSGGATISAGANSSNTLTLSGTQAQINAALATLMYRGDTNYNGSDSLTVISTDSDGTPLSDTDTVSITVNAVNDAPLNNLTGQPQVIASSSVDGATDVHVADLDGDGDVDLVSTSWTDDRVTWFQNDGSGNLTEYTVATGVSGARHAYVADIDGDGHQDIIVSDYENDTVTWYENDGSATPSFTAHTITNSADGAWSSFAIDMDNDGDMDVLSVSIWDDKVAWYENDGSSTPNWTEHFIGYADGGRTVVAGDIDNDGDVDVATASYVDDSIAWFESDGAATPSFTKNTISTNALGAMSVEIADVDNDGDLDLVSASYADNKISWYENDGNADPTFTENIISTNATGARDVTTADMDGDGDLDIISASFSDDKIAWYENQDSVFTEHLISQSADGARAVAVADLDGDGDLDVAAASLNDDSIGYFENTDGTMGNQATNEDTPLVFNAANNNLISISDVDHEGSNMHVRLEITNGTISLSGITGLSFYTGTGSNDSIVEFTGSLANINAALDGMTFTPTNNFNGDASVRIITNDLGNTGSGGVLSDDDTISIRVDSVNDTGSFGGNTSATTNEDTATAGTVTFTDTADGYTGNTFAMNTAASNGTASIDTAGNWTYTPNANFNGSDSFTVQVTDDDGNVETQVITVTVNQQNDAGTFGGDVSATTNEDTATAGTVTFTDAADGFTTPNFSINANAANGTAAIDAAGNWTYTPNADFNGSDSFTVQVTDDDGNVETQVINITVSAVDDTSILVTNSALTVPEESTQTITSSYLNATDVDNTDDQIVYTLSSLPGSGSVRLNGSSLGIGGTFSQQDINDGLVTYRDGDDGDSGTFNFTISDGNTTTGPYTFTINGIPINDAPVNTVSGAQTDNEDSSINITGISVNDVDGNLATTQLSVNNGTLNVNLTGGATISSGANGTSTLTLSGTQTEINAALATLSYQGNLNFNGSDTLTVTSTDNDSTPLNDTDTVSITINQVNDAGTFGGNTSATTNEDTATAGTVTFTDTADGYSSNTFALNTNASNGTATIDAAGNWTYTPSANFYGSDSFTVQVTDDDGNVETQVISITVNQQNDAGTFGGNTSATTNEDTATAGTVTFSDTVDGFTTPNFSVQTNAANGTATIDAAGNWTYTPSANFNGSDSFTVQVTDDDGNVETQVISITVNQQNDTGTFGGNTSATTNEDTATAGTVTFTDAADGYTGNTFALAVQAFNGNATIDSSGNWTYTPSANFNGSDSFTILVTDDDGNTQALAISITVTQQNDAGTFGGNTSATTNEDTATAGTVTFTDAADGYTGNTFAINAAASNGMATIDTAGNWTYTPNADFNGSDSFTVQVTDDDGNVETQVINISVSAVNDAPTNTGGMPTDISVTEDVLSNVDLSSINFSDVDANGAAITITLSTDNTGELFAVSSGGVTVTNSGTDAVDFTGTLADLNTFFDNASNIQYLNSTANLNGNDADVIYVNANDLGNTGSGGAQFVSLGSVFVDIASVNDAPVINNLNGDTLNYHEDDGAVVIDQSGDAVVSDVDSVNFDGGTLTVAFTTGDDDSEDRLSIQNIGTGVGEIGVSGSNVTYEGVIIGTSSGGGAGTDLVITFNTNATSAAVSELIQNITYENTDTLTPTTGARTVDFTLTDGDGGSSATQTTTINVAATNDDAFTFSIESSDVNYTENDGAVAVTSLIRVADFDDTHLESAVVQITGNYVNGEDVLSFTDQNGITGSWNATTGTLTLSGTATVADYEAALRSVTYTNNSENPNTTDRTVSFTVNDGDSNSNTATRNIAITSVNDDPVNTVPGSQTVNEDTALNISGISVNDVDGNLATTQLSVNNGTLNVSLAGGATISAGSNASGTLTLSGTQTQINAALATLSYQGNLNFNGSDSLTLISTDSDGTPLSDTDTVSITVNQANDAGTFGGNTSATTNEDTATAGTVTFTDTADGFTTPNFSINTNATNGTATIDAAGNWTYTPSANFNGSDSFTVQVTDDDGNVETQVISITVNQQNDAGTFGGNTSATTNEDTATAGTVTFTNTADGFTTPNFSINTNATNGTAAIDAAGNWTYTPSANFNGSDSFTVQVTDDDGNVETQVISINVNQINNAGTFGGNTSATTNEDTATAGTVTFTDSVDGFTTPNFSINTAATNGTATIDTAGNWTYTPNANYNGSDSFTVQVMDDDGNVETQVINITVNQQNDVGTFGGNTSATTNEDTATAGTVTFTDTADGFTTPNFSINTAATNGTASIDTAGNWTYTPNANYNGSDSFTVQITDDDGNVETQVINVTVSQQDDTGTFGGNTSATTNEDTATAGTVTFTDTADGFTTPNFSINANATNGTATIDAAGNWTYTPSANFNGSDSFTVQVTDDDGNIETQVISITVNAVNDAGTFGGDTSTTTNEDTATAGTVTFTDTADGFTTPNFSINANATNGTATIDAAGNWTYTPNANYNGSDSFIVQVTDDDGNIETQVINITVNSVNDSPVNTVPGAQTVNEDTVLNITGISVNDVDNNLASTQLTVSNGNLTVDLSGGATISSGSNNSNSLTLIGSQAQINSALASLSYQGNLNFNGSDTLSITSIDSDGVPLSDIDTVSITVNPVNDNPVATNEIATLDEGATVNINVAANDTDVDSSIDLTSVQIVSGPANGSVIVNPDGTVDYTHDGSENYTDTFTYSIRDASGLISNVATVTLTINPINDIPIASDDNVTVNEGSNITFNLVSNDVDPEGLLDLTSITIVSNPTNGILINNNDGTIEYYHDGSETTSDSFTYTINDTAGLISNLATVNITINPVNDAPEIVDNEIYFYSENGNNFSTLNLQATDADNLDATLSFSVSSVAGGQFEDISNPGVEITTFTQQQVNDGEIRFALASGETPYYEMTVSDSLLSHGPDVAVVFQIVVDEELGDVILIEIEPKKPFDDHKHDVSKINISVEDQEALIKVQLNDISSTSGDVNPYLEEADRQDGTLSFKLDLESNGKKHLDNSLTHQLFKHLLFPEYEQVKASQLNGYDESHIETISQSLDDALANFRKQIQQDSEISQENLEFIMDVSQVAGITLSVGSLTWLLRLEWLFSVLLSTVPTWRALDPLAILSASQMNENAQSTTEDQNDDELSEDAKAIIDSIRANSM